MFLRPTIPRGVDDGTVAVSVDLKACLVPDPVQRVRPLNFHERTGHILPDENNLLHFYIKDTEQFVAENNMVINKQKTKGISLTKSRKYYLYLQKARQKHWILRRMLDFNLDLHQLYAVYSNEIRSILELAVPVWHSGLT